MIALLMLLSVAGLSVPFIHYFSGWVSLAALIPFFLLLLRMQSLKKPCKEQFLIIWLTGLVSFLVVLGWCLQTSPEKWTFISGWWASIALVGVYIVFALIFSLQYVVFAGLWLYYKPNFYKKTIYIILPAFWVLAEAARSVLFSIISFGQGGSIGLNWNFGVMGIAAGVTPLGYLGRIVGMFGLSFVVVVINICVFWIAKKRFKLPLIILGGIFLATLLAWCVWRPTSNQIAVSFVQLPQSFDGYTAYEGYYQSIEEKASGRSAADVLVLPEYSEFFTDHDHVIQAKATAQKLVVPDGVLITSISAGNDNSHDNRLVVYRPDGQIIANQDKTFLIPIGEYLPYVITGVFRLFGQDQLLHLHENTRVVLQGHEKEQSLSSQMVRLGSLACSGAIAPELYRNLALGGAQIFTNSASLGIFTGAPLYHQQSQQFAHFLAVANARPYIQGASGAYSYIIDSDGRFVVRTINFQTDYGQAKVGLVSGRTIYTILGEWVVLVSAGIVVVCIGKKFQSRRKNNLGLRGIVKNS